MKPYKFHAAALAELEVATRYYTERSAQAAVNFVTEFVKARNLILSNPFISNRM